MKPVEAITVAGFRGLLSELTLSLVKGVSPRSLVLYGGNGTGKSSLTDALEWLQTGQVVRLRREDAGPRSYANRAADFDPYVRLKLRGQGRGSAGLVYSRTRITMPEAEGELDAVRAAAPHPWQIRNEDLSRFVALTKALRFDALAGLMGFLPQVEFQKQLRRVANALGRRRSQRQAVLDEVHAHLQTLLGSPDTSSASCLRGMNESLAGLDMSIGDLAEAPRVRDELGQRISSDPRSETLAALRALRTAVSAPVDIEALAAAADELLEALASLRRELRGGADLSRIQLLEMGLQHLDESQWASGGLCPLCGAAYEGDLTAHVREELERLERLRTLQRLVRGRQATARQELEGLLRRTVSDQDSRTEAERLGVLEAYDALDESRGGVRALLEEA